MGDLSQHFAGINFVAKNVEVFFEGEELVGVPVLNLPNEAVSSLADELNNFVVFFYDKIDMLVHLLNI